MAVSTAPQPVCVYLVKVGITKQEIHAFHVAASLAVWTAQDQAHAISAATHTISTQQIIFATSAIPRSLAVFPVLHKPPARPVWEITLLVVAVALPSKPRVRSLTKN